MMTWVISSWMMIVKKKKRLFSEEEVFFDIYCVGGKVLPRNKDGRFSTVHAKRDAGRGENGRFIVQDSRALKYSGLKRAFPEGGASSLGDTESNLRRG